MKQFIAPGLIVVAATALVVALVSGRIGGRPEVHYPYVCKDCHAVFDVSELKTDDSKWRIPPGAGSDSVVYCLRCNKGWAYPVAKCDQCATQFILHLSRDSRCPKCFPEAAAAAKKQGVDVFFHAK